MTDTDDLRIGVDTGGTFTDLVVHRPGARPRTLKVRSTPDDPGRAILEGLRQLGFPGGAGARVVHGTTVALNALLTGRGTDRAALVTNRGFRDLIEIDRQTRPDLYALEPVRPQPLAHRERRFEVDQRTEPVEDTSARRFTETARPSDGAIAELVQDVLASGAESVAVCLLHSYGDPEPERRIASALRAAGLAAVGSAELVAEYREAERFSTALVNAAVTPPMGRYLRQLGAALPGVRLDVLQSSGGTLGAERAAREPVRVLLSGPAGGMVGAARAARSIGRGAVATLDMGGTSTDVGFHDPSGLGALGDEVRVAGYAIAVPTLDMHTVGCGGGSIARVGPGGALTVGPMSAGADPGPACFGRGGTMPTVTDAWALLGRIPHEPLAEGFLGGAQPLNVAAATRAYEDLGRALGASAVDAAAAVVEAANASMRRALGVMTMERGRDPETTPLVAFGGGGGLAAAELMLGLGMPEALVPEGTGVLSALGMTVAPEVCDRSRTLLRDLGGDSMAEAAAILVDLERDALAALDTPSMAVIERSLCLRYRGQSYDLPMTIDSAKLPDVDALGGRFHAAHGERFGWRLDEHPIEIVTARVRARVEVDAGEGSGPAGGASIPVPLTHQPVQVLEGTASAPVFARMSMAVDGDPIPGPAIVVDSTSTTWVPPGVTARLTSAGLLLARIGAILCLALAVVGPVDAGPPQEQADELRVDEGLDAAQQRLAELEVAANLDPDVKTRAIDATTATISRLEEALAHREQSRRWAEEAEQPAPAIDAGDAPPAPLPAFATLEELQLARDAWRVRVQRLEELVAGLEERRRRRDDRRRNAGVAMERARTELDELRASEPRFGPDADPRLAAALRGERDARAAELEARIAMRVRDGETFQAIQSRLDVASELAAVRLAEARTTLESMENGLLELSTDQTGVEVTGARRALADAPSPLRELARATLKLAEDTRDLVDENRTTIDAKRDTARDAQALERRYDALKRRADKALSTQQIAELLRRERTNLPDLRSLQRSFGTSVARSSALELQALDIEDEVEARSTREATLRGVVRAGEVNRDTAARYLDAHGAQLRSKQSAVRALLRTLEELEQEAQKERTYGRLLKDFVDERVLWVRSTSAVWRMDRAAFQDTTTHFASPLSYRGVPRAVARALLVSPGKALSLLGLAVLCAFIRKRIARYLEERTGAGASPEERRQAALSIKPTLLSLARAAAGAAFFPALVAAFAIPLRSGVEDPMARLIGTGLAEVLVPWFLLGFAWRIAKQGGLGEGALQWGAANMRAARSHLRWFTPLYLVLSGVSAAIHASGEQSYKDTLGRVIFDALLIAVGLFLGALLRRSGLKPAPGGGSILARLRGLWLLLGVGSAMTLAGASMLGFHFTARNLRTSFELTLVLLGALLLARAVVGRWILVSRRRLRIEQAQERRRQEEREREAGGTSAKTVDVESEESVDLGSLEEEVGDLLRFVTGSAAFLGIVAIWFDFFPALVRLDDLVLHAPTVGPPLTVLGLATAALAAFLTAVLAKRLPGLIEFTLLNRFRMGSGERYAIRAVTSYLVVAVGVVITLGFLGFTWGSVQWLVAAVSVGLGFGLQEIFANFVSGLILLFERPIRVGDLVTVAGTEGRVTQIRIRATTILDYDRRELIVPNREFVTGSLVNWSLSDSITRVVIPVGIAYGSDVEVAKSLMLRAARDCQEVLAEPKTTVVFRGFGDSSLDFQVRVFMADRDDWPEVMDFMHVRMDALFRKKGIEIPFPQRDLHLKSAAPETIEVFGRP